MDIEKINKILVIKLILSSNLFLNQIYNNILEIIGINIPIIDIKSTIFIKGKQ